VSIRTIDNSGQANYAEALSVTSFTVADGTAPVIGVTTATDGDPDADDDITIITSVTDSYGIATVEFQIVGITGWLPMTFAGGTSYQALWSSSGNPENAYDVNIRATDNSIAHNPALANSDASFNLIDLTNPVLTARSSDGTVYIGFSPNYYDVNVTITDSSGLSEVRLIVQNTTDVIFDQPMTLVSGNDYTIVWEMNMSYFGGDYNISFVATDNSAANNVLTSNNFSVVIAYENQDFIVVNTDSSDVEDICWIGLSSWNLSITLDNRTSKA
jgi:hypothetical protein